MNSELDSKIKEFLMGSENLEMPEKFSKGVDYTLSEITNKYKKKKIKKHIMAASISMFVILGLGTTFSVMAQDSPLINKVLGKYSIFNTRFNNNNLSNLKNVQDYSTSVEQSVKNNNVNITMKEIAYDGAAVYIVYETSGDIKTDRISSTKTININGKKFESENIIPEKLSDNSILTTEIIPINNETLVSDKVNISIKFTSIQGKNGEWSFNFDFNKNDLVKNIKTIQLNKEITIDSDKVKILSLTQTPTFISLTSQHERYNPDSEFFTFSLIDTKGNELTKTPIQNINKEGNKVLVSSLYKLAENTKVSTIKVTKSKDKYFSPETIISKTNMELTGKLPKKITIGKGKDIVINKIDKSNDKYEITINSKDIPISDYVFKGGISLYNRKLDIKDHNAYHSASIRLIGENTYKVTILQPISKMENENNVLAFGNYDDIIQIVSEVNLDNQ